ncbi:hypothetical protein POV27_14155 [Aureisphaera galaxeae]|uniref:hypothetical protein n=1 Tax=Aureisphaera galaxeae TaxID=1538023 RepID=UPI00235074D7|nr:hypothetical protein [Aureisphaera galaxeae]MDC8005200.1 hypothetical protein [Aureisphaera galaxeae]
MSKSEEADLYILVKGLKPKRFNSFKRSLNDAHLSNKEIKLKLLEALKKRSFNKVKFLEKNHLEPKKYNAIKYELFQELLDHLKVTDDPFSDVALQNEVVELEVLLKNGLYVKAKRKLDKIKKIGREKCDFNVCCQAQRKALEYRLFNYGKGKNNFKEATIELKELLELSFNLESYKLLSNEVVELHYQFLDKRIKNRKPLLEFKDHELLKGNKKPKSVLAVYYYYRAKSLAHLGDNDFQECKRYSLLAYEHLSDYPSPYRNDYLLQIRALNNYLDSSMNLSETLPFEETFPKIEALATQYVGKIDSYTDAMTFQFMASLKLNYVWLKKDVDAFISEFPKLQELYNTYDELLSPNIRLEILLGFARMHFLMGDLSKANSFCVAISDEKSNPTSLFISCGNILRVMINHDMGNHYLIPHLISTSKYFLKNKERLFTLERSILNGLHKIKPYYSDAEKSKLFQELYAEIDGLLLEVEDATLNEKIGILDWLQSKTS